jgi:ribonuclease T2
MKLNKSIIFGIGAAVIAGVGTYNYTHQTPIKSNQTTISEDKSFKPIENNKSFDFYVLSLSWSPTYCMLNDGDKSSQCQENHNFIVHGLWPQYEQGYPRECASNVKHIDYKLVQSMLDIMPSERLVNIEWGRHGTCTSLSPDKYFKTVRAAYEVVKIPQLSADTRYKAGDIENAFIKVNNGLANDMIAVTTKEGKLNEVRICMTQGLEFRPCPEVNRNAARENYRLFVPAP